MMSIKTIKPLKTAAELEAAIRREMEDSCQRLPSIPVTVLPDGDSWKVVFPQHYPVDRNHFETILLVSDRLRSQFDLAT
jgi:hypothetical protein